MSVLFPLVMLVALVALKAWVMLGDPSHPQYDTLPERWKRPPRHDRGSEQ